MPSSVGDGGQDRHHEDGRERRRGTTRRRTGEIAIARSASTCSVTVIEPISAVMPEPTRPPTMSAVRTGPSSRTSESETTRPDEHLSAEGLERVRRLQGEHHAGEERRDPGDRDAT